jgi:hypothetical protein
MFAIFPDMETIGAFSRELDLPVSKRPAQQHRIRHPGDIFRAKKKARRFAGLEFIDRPFFLSGMA